MKLSLHLVQMLIFKIVMEQIDKIAKKHKGRSGSYKDVKKAHARKKRREAKNIDAEHPLWNRYVGWVM